MKNKLFNILALAAIVIAVFIGISLLINNSKVNALESTPIIYYTSYSVKSKDTLWSIAEKYKWDGCTTKEYIRLVKKVNNLPDDTIKSGSNIIIMYVPEE